MLRCSLGAGLIKCKPPLHHHRRSCSRPICTQLLLPIVWHCSYDIKMPHLLCSTLLPGSPKTGLCGFRSVLVSLVKQPCSTDLAPSCYQQSHGGSVAVKPTDAQFVIFPTADFSPPEQMQLDAFKKRDVPTVRLPWLVRMRRLGCITSWTQWACDPAYHTEPLVEDQEVAVQLRMLGVDNIEDESVNLGEICKNLSRRVRADLLIPRVVIDKVNNHFFTDIHVLSTVSPSPNRMVRRTAPRVSTRSPFVRP